MRKIGLVVVLLVSGLAVNAQTNQKYLKELVSSIKKETNEFEGYEVYKLKKNPKIGMVKTLKFNPYILITEGGEKLFRTRFAYASSVGWLFAEKISFIAGSEKFSFAINDPSRKTIGGGSIMESFDILMTEEQFYLLSYNVPVKLRLSSDDGYKDFEFTDNVRKAYTTIYEYNNNFMN